MGLRLGGAESAQEQRAGSEPVKGLAGKVEGTTRGGFRKISRQGCAQQGEDDGRDGQDGQVAEKRLGR